MTEVVKLNHQEFVKELSRETNKFRIRIIKTKEFANLFFDNSTKIYLTALSYMLILPLIIVPLICFVTGKWILLLGFIGIFSGYMLGSITQSTSIPIHSLIKNLLVAVFVGSLLIYSLEIFNAITFIFICNFYQSLLIGTKDIVYNTITKNHLINNLDNYYYAIDKGIIETYFVS